MDSPKGESRRQIEPYYLIFKWSNWYVWGWCQERDDFRLFKLNCMEEVNNNGHTFEGRECPLPDLRDVSVFPGEIELKALFRSNFANKDYLIDWLLRFRDGVELIEPEEIRAEMQKLLESMSKVHGGIR